MENIADVKYISFKLDEQGYIKKSKKYNKFKKIKFEIPYQGDENVLKRNLEIIKEMVNQGYIPQADLSFDVSLSYDDLSYQKWQTLINFASEHNINFRVNASEEYSFSEMKDYIDAFTKEVDGEKQFVFDVKKYKFENNPFVEDIEKREDIFESAVTEYSVYIGKENRKNFPENVSKIFNEFNGFMRLCLDNGISFDQKAKEEIIWMINYLKDNYPDYKFDIKFSTHYRYYTKDEFVRLLEVEEYIKNNYDSNYELSFSNGKVVYTKEQVVAANNKINKTVEKLKTLNLSPYEKVMFLSRLLIEKDYYKCESESDLSRDLYSVLNTRNIICIGYSNLMDMILEELKDENLKSKSETIALYRDKKEQTYHSTNCIYIKDEKYGIEGYYNLDIIYSQVCLGHFMAPVEDVDGWYAEYYKESIKFVGALTGNLYNNSIPIYPPLGEGDTGSDYYYHITIKNEDNYKEKILSNTKEMLDTPMGRNLAKEMGFEIKGEKEALKVINAIIEKTKPIPIEFTQDALETVAQKCLGLSEGEAKIYSKNLITQSIFHSLFALKRNVCDNEFARLSKEIEQVSKKNKKIETSKIKR